MDNFTVLLNLGFAAIPVDKSSKRPLVSWTEFQSRLPLEREVYWWKRRFNDCNVGIVTGSVSGIVVLDIDSREGYEIAKQKGLPKTPSVVTGKGLHYYFLHPGYEVRNFARKLPGIDLRGDGGYVVAPGSYHSETERYYEWRDHPLDVPFAKIPFWLAQLFEKKDEPSEASLDEVSRIIKKEVSKSLELNKYGDKAFKEEVAILLDSVSGTRNNNLFRVAVRLYELAKANELDMGLVNDTLHRTAELIGLKTAEIKTTLNSAYKTSHPKPRPKLIQ